MSIVLDNVSSGYSTGLINDNFQKLEDYINNNLLNRDNTAVGEANQMEVNLDMNSFSILNVGKITAQDFQFQSISNQSLEEIVEEAYNWAQYPVDSLVPEGNGTDEYSAFHYATKAGNDLFEFRGIYWGAFSSEPSTDPNGNTADAGDLYFNTTTNLLYAYNGTEWRDVPESEASNVTFVATGAISATNVQAALEELDTEKVPRTSTTGSAVVPSGTSAQRDGTPTAGYLRFNSEINLYEGYDGTQWVPVGSGATGSAGDQVFVQNDQTVTADYTIPSDKNAMTTGPITIQNGVTVTVSSGSRWVII